MKRPRIAYSQTVFPIHPRQGWIIDALPDGVFALQEVVAIAMLVWTETSTWGAEKTEGGAHGGYWLLEPDIPGGAESLHTRHDDFGPDVMFYCPGVSYVGGFESWVGGHGIFWTREHAEQQLAEQVEFSQTTIHPRAAKP